MQRKLSVSDYKIIFILHVLKYLYLTLRYTLIDTSTHNNKYTYFLYFY